MAGPLFTAQQTARDCRRMLIAGQAEALKSFSKDTTVTVEELRETFKNVPLLTILELFKPEESYKLSEKLLKAASDLDFVNDVIDLLAKYDSLNPQLHSILAAYRRRAVTGKFKLHNVPTELEYVRFAQQSDQANGVESKPRGGRQRGGRSIGVCRAFQQGKCTFQPCRYRHVCAICYRSSHAATSCWFKGTRGQASESKSNDNSGDRRNPSVPPSPRHRRSRVSNNTSNGSN